MTAENTSGDYLTDDQRERLQSTLQHGHEAVTDDERDATDEETTFEVDDDATVAISCTNSAGIVSVTNETLGSLEFRELQNEVQKIAVRAGVGEVEVHERMSDFASFHVDYS